MKILNGKEISDVNLIGKILVPIVNLSGFKNSIASRNEHCEDDFPLIGTYYTVRSVKNRPKKSDVISLDEFTFKRDMMGVEDQLNIDWFRSPAYAKESLLSSGIDMSSANLYNLLDAHIYSKPKEMDVWKPDHPSLIKPYESRFEVESKKKNGSSELINLIEQYLPIFGTPQEVYEISGCTKIRRFRYSKVSLLNQILQFRSLGDCLRGLEYSIKNNLKSPNFDNGTYKYKQINL